MSEDKSNGGGKEQLKALAKVTLVILVTVLTVAVANRLSDEAQRVLAGVICGLGVIVTLGMLVILIRQYDRGD
ncbi:MAG: hypothetical protein DRI48_11425 [Chloroflexi bacterium]|nr:MAG: hypothetical protein DRI48_11425 [Chloroflexota bacterium]